MCVIAVKINGVNLNTSDIVNMYNTNPQGVGLSYKRHDGKFIIDKFIPTSSKDMLEYISKHHSYIYDKHAEVVMHFRIATSGKIDAATCHPYKINSEAVLYHNGVVNSYLNNKELSLLDKMSDTQVFAINHVTNFKSYNELWSYTEYNKFAVHHIDGKIELFGAFTTHNNLIVSNTHYVAYRPIARYNNALLDDDYTTDIPSTTMYDAPYIDNATIDLDYDYQELLYTLYIEHKKEYELVKKTGAIESFSEYIVTKYSMYGDDIESILDNIMINQ